MGRISNKADTAIKWICFLISPFIAFVYSLRNMKAKSSFVVFFLFAVFFGMAFTVSWNRNEEGTSDGTVYRYLFENMSSVTFDDYMSVWQDYTTLNHDKDVYFITVAFLVSRLTNNYHFLFCFFAIVFAFFQLKSLRFLTNEEKFNASLSSYLLVIMFVVSNSIFNINGVRFWTAAWVGVYCIFQIFLNNNKKYFILACVTPLIHISFVGYLMILLIAYFSKKHNSFWIIMYALSFVISNLSLDFITAISSFLPGAIRRIINGYATANAIVHREENTSLLKTIFLFMERMYINLMLILCYINRKKILQNSGINVFNLLSFLLIWMTFVNFTMPIPSLGGRFFRLSLPVIAYIWLVTFKGIKYKPVLYAFPFIFIYTFAVEIVRYMLVTDIYFYISNPFYLINNYLLS